MPCERVCDWKTFRRRAGRRVGVWLRTFVACHIVAAACLCCCAACNIVGATCCCRCCCCCWRCFLFDSAYKCCNVQLLNSSAAAATFKWLRLPQKLCAFVPLKCNPQIVQNPEKKTLPYPWSSRNKTNPQKKRINENSCWFCWEIFWQRDFIWSALWYQGVCFANLSRNYLNINSLLLLFQTVNLSTINYKQHKSCLTLFICHWYKY